MIALRAVHYRAGKHFAVESLDMTVPTGSIYGFIGPNGAGKTTTMRLILGLLTAKSGTVELLGHPMPRDARIALAKVGVVPERPHVYPTFTVDEAMRFHSAFHRGWDASRAAKLRAQFELLPNQLVGSLSKGQTGKLMMLLALSQSPDLLILDEPTDGLDPVVRQEVLEALTEFVATKKATVLVSSHLVHEQERICDWVGVMDHGRLIAELPMTVFRNGIKRLRVGAGVSESAAKAAPFLLVSRRALGDGAEEWLVRNWDESMHSWFVSVGVPLQEVIDLDLEQAFVSLLRAARATAAAATATTQEAA
jgi:ABC-2 type transport system ATP-binding protein